MNLNISINKKKNEFDEYYKNLLSNYLSKDKLSKAMIYGSMNEWGYFNFLKLVR